MAATNPTTNPPVGNKKLDGDPSRALRSAPMTYKVKAWARFQHFKNRRPPWIKLYRDLLDDMEWHQLDGDSAKMLTALWLLGSESGDGTLPSIERLAFRLRTTEKQVKSAISKLSHWILSDDDTTISSRHRDDPSETETETEREKETKAATPPGLDPQAWKDWTAYRRGLGKPIKPVSEAAAMKKLAGFGQQQVTVVEQSVAQGWTGLFPLKADLRQAPPDKPAPTTAQIQAQRARAAEQNRAVAEKLDLPKLRP